MNGVRGVLLALTAAAVLLVTGPVLEAGDAGQRGPSSNASPVAARKTAPNRLRDFLVTAREGEITPATIKVRRGDRVRITFVSKDSTYGVKIKQYSIKRKVKPGEPVTVEFIAEKKGTFPLRCSKLWGFKRWKENGKIVVR
ncbi:MAG: cupredoxin domain-containing protein [Acidobacteriota bacterium]